VNSNVSETRKINLMGLHRAALREHFEALGEKPYRADQVVRWIHHAGLDTFESMTNINRTLRQRLEDTAQIAAPEVVREQVSPDGTRKWMLRLADGNVIETVYIPEPDRGTLCISSQAGCALNCTFCATGRQGFSRNLEAHEIIGQVWRAHERLGRTANTAERPITNVVLMGMGEPLLNFDNVVGAMDLMLDDLAYGLSRRRVTLSTAGLVPAMDRLSEICPVSLAVSLHAPDDALRDRLVPLNRKYPIAELLEACRRYVSRESRRRVTFEYVMLKGVNDSEGHARALARLVRDLPAKVNLIPFNPFADSGFERSSQTVIDRFRDILLDAGITTITRSPGVSATEPGVPTGPRRPRRHCHDSRCAGIARLPDCSGRRVHDDHGAGGKEECG
jgi:23S rRNA (adenine2503-C2)-methyltransferase